MLFWHFCSGFQQEMVCWIVAMRKCAFFLFIMYVLLLISNWDLTLNKLYLWVKICSSPRTKIKKRGQGWLLINVENILSASLKMIVFIFLVFRVYLMHYSLEELRLGVVVPSFISWSFGRKISKLQSLENYTTFCGFFWKIFLYLCRFFSFCFSFK